MTKNQIELAKLQETRRSNLAQEGLSKSQQSEVKRHNLASELVSQGTLSESQRHNLATESQARQELGVKVDTLAETKRANMAKEQVAIAQHEETVRANKAKEAETYRSNVEREQEATFSRLQDAEFRRVQTGLEATKAQAAMKQAQASTAQVEASQRQADIAEAKLDSEVALNMAKLQQALSDAEYKAIEKAYLSDKNAQAWIRTVSGALVDGAKAGKDIMSIVSSIGAMSGGGAGAAAVYNILAETAF